MSLCIETQAALRWITLNRPEKNNAFDGPLMQALTAAIQEAIDDPTIQVIGLAGAGKHFSAGADLQWMQQMATASLEENEADAKVLATLLHTLYHCPKPTVAKVQGKTYGGGLGLIAACDIAIASSDASFCFSEVNLGLIPAVISPFVIAAIGPKAANALFLSAQPFDANDAQRLHLIHTQVPAAQLQAAVDTLTNRLSALPTQALQASKALVKMVSQHPIDDQLLTKTAKMIATQRQTPDAKTRMARFLAK